MMGYSRFGFIVVLSLVGRLCAMSEIPSEASRARSGGVVLRRHLGAEAAARAFRQAGRDDRRLLPRVLYGRAGGQRAADVAGGPRRRSRVLLRRFGRALLLPGGEVLQLRCLDLGVSDLAPASSDDRAEVPRRPRHRLEEHEEHDALPAALRDGLDAIRPSDRTPPAGRRTGSRRQLPGQPPDSGATRPIPCASDAPLLPWRPEVGQRAGTAPAAPGRPSGAAVSQGPPG